MNHKVSKIDISLVQLRTAIQLYNKRNFISAITLAGASEEILGQIAKRSNGRNALIDDFEWTNQIADYLKKNRPPLRKTAAARNKLKNELKHNDSGHNKDTESDFQFEAETFIIAAITNYEIIAGHLPKDRIIRAFWNWISM
jgi:hypothetical protein